MKLSFSDETTEMRSGIAKASGGVGGLLALVSGYFWWQSADFQVQILTTLANASPEGLAKLTVLSAKENLWAGGFATASGFLIVLGVVFD